MSKWCNLVYNLFYHSLAGGASYPDQRTEIHHMILHPDLVPDQYSLWQASRATIEENGLQDGVELTFYEN